MTTQELAGLINKEGLLRSTEKGLDFGVRITDARMSYGNVQVEITPRMGIGYAWVALDRVVL